MDFKLKKGSTFADAYYTFFYYFINEEYENLMKFYEVNLWWFSKLKPEARKQCEIEYNKIKADHGSEVVNCKSYEFFKEEYK